MTRELLETPLRPPELSDGSMGLWLPAQGEPGLLMTNGPEPRLDMAFAAPVFAEPGVLQQLHNYLGVYYELTEEGYNITHKASFLGVGAVNERLTALDVPPEHKPPLLAAWEGGDFPAEVALDYLIDNGRFLTATEGRLAAHDMLVHFASAQVLMSPADMDQLAARGMQAKQRGQTAIEGFMEHLDVELSSVGLGKWVAKALGHEHRAAQRKGACADDLAIAANEYWNIAGKKYAQLVAPTESYIDPAKLREHCLVLSSAALSQIGSIRVN
jgi:hypothetical protein